MDLTAYDFKKDDEYYTPKSILDTIAKIENIDWFDYDPATNQIQTEYLEIKNYDTIETDGLKADWSSYKNIWINPPFTMKNEFLKKAIETYTNDKTKNIYLLIPIAFLTTKQFHKILDFENVFFKLFIPTGRICFLKRGYQEKKFESPAFGCVIIKLQDHPEMVKFDI